MANIIKMETNDELVPITCKEENLLNDIDIDMQQFDIQQKELLSDGSLQIHDPVVITNEPEPLNMEMRNICEDKHSLAIDLPYARSLSPSVLKKRPETSDVEYRINQDVLVKHADGRLYLGTVISIRHQLYQVQYDDSMVHWISKEDLNKLDSEDSENKDTICTICKHKSKERTRNCCLCLRGFHASCLPFEERLIVIQSEPWFMDWHCKECHEKDTPTLRMSDNSTLVTERVPNSRTPIWPEGLDPLTDKSQLPYNFERLSWDTSHRTNTSGEYCYCGHYGLWTREMIMCRRCQQWFHSHCIRSLQFPLFFGDPFYFFLCSICNHGHEFVRRVEMSWRELVHLALYNLMIRNRKQYFSVENAIAPYIEENLRTLQLPQHMINLTAHDRQKSIIKHLQIHKECFKHLKKVDGNSVRRFWTLRFIFPPELQLSDVPQDNIITEQSLKHLGSSDRSIQFLPRSFIERSLVNDVECRELMQGLKYALDSPSSNDFVRLDDTDSSEESDLSSSSRTPDLDQEMEGANDIKKKRTKKTNQHLRQKSRGRKAALLATNQGTTQKTPQIHLPPLDELIPALDHYKGKNNPFHPLFGQNDDDPLAISEDTTPCSTATLPLPSGAKRRKCYRPSIEYHLHHDTVKEETIETSNSTTIQNSDNSGTSTNPNNNSDAIGNCQPIALVTEITDQPNNRQLRERKKTINYSLTRPYKKRDSSVGADSSDASGIRKRRQSVCGSITKPPETQTSGKFKRRMSVCAEVFRSQPESIESLLSSSSTKVRSKDEISANKIAIHEIQDLFNNKRYRSSENEDSASSKTDTCDSQVSKKRRKSVCESINKNPSIRLEIFDKYKRRTSVCEEMFRPNKDSSVSQIRTLSEGKTKDIWKRITNSRIKRSVLKCTRTLPNGEVQHLISQRKA